MRLSWSQSNGLHRLIVINNIAKQGCHFVLYQSLVVFTFLSYFVQTKMLRILFLAAIIPQCMFTPVSFTDCGKQNNTHLFEQCSRFVRFITFIIILKKFDILTFLWSNTLTVHQGCPLLRLSNNRVLTVSEWGSIVITLNKFHHWHRLVFNMEYYGVWRTLVNY